MKKSIKYKIIFIIFLLIILIYYSYFYYINRDTIYKTRESFCGDCRVKPDVGSDKNINNFITSTNNQSGETNPPMLSQTILSNRCTYLPVGVSDSSYIFCPFTNNCQMPTYPGTYYNIDSITNKICSIDNSCCDTEFHNNNHYIDDNGIKHPGIVFSVSVDETKNFYETESASAGYNPYTDVSINNKIDFSYNIMKYTPVTAENNGYLPNILGKHYKTSIKDSTPLIIKSDSNSYIDCCGNLQKYTTNNYLPIFSNQTSAFNDPGKIWCLQSENQQYCKQNNNFVLTPNIDFNNNDEINYSNNTEFSENLITPGNLPNTSSNPYPSDIKFSSDNIQPSTITNDWLQTHLQPQNDSEIKLRHNPVFVNTPKVFTEACKIKNYRANPKF